MIKHQAFRILSVVEKCQQVNFSTLFVHLVKKGVVFVDDGSSDVLMFGGADKNTGVFLNGLYYNLCFIDKLNNFSFTPVLFQVIQHYKKGYSGFCRPNYLHLKNHIFVWLPAKYVHV